MENDKIKKIENEILLLNRKVMELTEENKILDNRIDDLILSIVKDGSVKTNRNTLIPNKLTGLISVVEERFDTSREKDTIYKFSEFKEFFDGYSSKEIKEMLYTVYKIKETSKSIRDKYKNKVVRGFLFYPGKFFLSNK